MNQVILTNVVNSFIVKNRNTMLYITQLIYVRKGQESKLHEFEAQAIPLLKKYGGKIVQRIRPTQESFIDGEALKPYEVHIVSFESEQNLKEFSQDPKRKEFVHLKEESVSEILMFMGQRA